MNIEPTPADIHRLCAADALRRLGSNVDGLSSAEAARRLRDFGPNQIEKIARVPAILRLLWEFVQFFSVILWIAAALAFVAEWSAPGQGMARIGYAIIGVILVSGVFSFWQEHRVERTLDALQELLPRQVGSLRGGMLSRIPADQLVPGEIVLIEQGDIVPADCRVIEASALRVNNATVTGEAMPQPRDAEPASDGNLTHASNILLAGTSIVSGNCKALVFATGAHTEFGKIARLAQSSADVPSPLRTQLAYLSRLIAVLAIAIGLVFFAAGAVIAVPFWENFILSIGIIVAMVPEGLLPTLTLALVLAAQRLAKRNVLVRHLGSVETLGSATVICTDKTGTLTQNRMRAQELLIGRERCTSDALPSRHDIQRFSPQFFAVAYRCHALHEADVDGQKVVLGDRMEVALVEMAQRAIDSFPAAKRLGEIPFDAERMRQSVIYEMEGGRTLYCKGAPEAVLPRCRQILDGGKVVPLDKAGEQTIADAQTAMAEKGLRVLGFAMKELPSHENDPPAEEELTFLGLVGLEDPPRPGVAEAIRRCGAAGIKVIMVTGDHAHTAIAIGREIGLIRSREPAVISGDALRQLAEAELERILEREEIIFARASPDQKLRVVEALTRQGHVVAATGDGVNDAPALKAAHIGISMGIAGSEVARATSDVVLLDDNFVSIVSGVEEGRAVFQNIRKFLTYVLVHNVAELVPYLGFALFAIPLPLTPIQILAIDMGTDSLTALGLGVEEPHPQAMLQPPRPKTERLMNLGLALRAYLFLGLIEAAAAMAAFFFVLKGVGWVYGQQLAPGDPAYRAATMACLGAIIVMQIVNVFLCRSSIRSVFRIGFFSNPLILWGVALEFASLWAIGYTPWGNLIFGTAPPPSSLWLLLAPFALAMLVLEELRKWLARRVRA
ncbi:MAG TPA: cation-transporting P-type ATPase [Stellaceae bacterium]|nr:cation-transporting P-type ATPase [Stellaceae bacterium]